MFHLYNSHFMNMNSIYFNQQNNEQLLQYFNQSIQQNIETEEPDIDVEEIQSVKNEPNNQDTDVMIIPPDFQNEAGSDNENEMAQQYPINLANKKKRNVQIERLNISPVSLNFF